MLWYPVFFVEGEFALGKHKFRGDHIWHIKGSKMWISTFHLKQFQVLLNNNIFFHMGSFNSNWSFQRKAWHSHELDPQCELEHILS